jgi:predicted RNase H-like HicB family nuclease
MYSFELKTRTRIYFDPELRLYVSSCPELGLVSQGVTEEDAERAIQSAINLFIITCYEHEKLHSILMQLRSASTEAQAV